MGELRGDVGDGEKEDEVEQGVAIGQVGRRRWLHWQRRGEGRRAPGGRRRGGCQSRRGRGRRSGCQGRRRRRGQGGKPGGGSRWRRQGVARRGAGQADRRPLRDGFGPSEGDG